MSVLTLDRRVAVLLRGPAGVGKTETGKSLLRLFGRPEQELVILDGWWAPAERRYNGGPQRYEDLKDNPNALLVMEVCWAEPADRSRLGSTLNPQEWFDVLVEEGRRVFIFHLTAPWPVAQASGDTQNRPSVDT